MATDATGTPTTALGIPKYNTAADIPSGKGFNAAMDYIDDLLEARTPAANPSTNGVKVWNNATKAWDAVTGTPDGTKFLRDDGAWAAPAAIKTYRAAGPGLIGTNTTAELTLFSQAIDANDLGTTKKMRVRVYAWTYNNFGANENGTLRIKANGATLESRTVYMNQGAATSRYPVFFELDIVADGAANSLIFNGLWAPGNRQFSDALGNVGTNYVVDTSVAWTLSATFAMSRAAGADEFGCEGHYIEVV